MNNQSLERASSDFYGNSCPECGSNILIPDVIRGETFCSECGIVTNDMLVSRSSEWRAFNAVENEKRNRVGAPRSNAIGDYGLSTKVGTNFNAIKGKISSERKFQLSRMSKWQSRVTNSKNINNLNIAMGILARLCSHLHIPRNVKEQTAVYYRKALKAGLVTGRSIESILVACLYAACRLTKTQRSLKEISEFSTCEAKELARCYRDICNNLELDIPREKAQNNVPKIANIVGIREVVQREAIDILRNAEEQKITGGMAPSSLAAAALYIACMITNTKTTQKEIAFAAGVSEVTLRNRYKGLVQGLGLQID